jgi:hypothetical protein
LLTREARSAPDCVGKRFDEVGRNVAFRFGWRQLSYMERHGTRLDLPSPVVVSPNLLDTVLHRDVVWAFYYE